MSDKTLWRLLTDATYISNFLTDSMYHYGKYANPEHLKELEEKLKNAKGQSDAQVDFEQLGHQAYTLQNLIICTQRDLELTQAQLTELSNAEIGNCDERIVTETILRGRLKGYQESLTALNVTYNATLKQLKDERYKLVSAPILEEIEQTKKDLATIEEAAKNIAENEDDSTTKTS